jgi:hypothetical protein
MNKKIKEITDKCYSNPIHKIGEFDQEKFATLIINECIELIIDQYLPILEDDEMMQKPMWEGCDSVVGIREHFGIEDE